MQESKTTNVQFTDMADKPPKYGKPCLVEYRTKASGRKECHYYLGVFTPAGWKFWRLVERLRPHNVHRWIYLSNLQKIGSKPCKKKQ